MMTKQRWETLRSLVEIPMDVFWEYYQESGGVIQEFPIFVQVFTEVLAGHKIDLGQFAMYTPYETVGKDGTKLRVTYETAVHRLYNYYDDKFTE